MKYREIAKKLRSLGCEEVPRQKPGSHRTWHNPQTDRMATLPEWGARDLKIGTLRAAIRQLGIDWQEFLNS